MLRNAKFAARIAEFAEAGRPGRSDRGYEVVVELTRVARAEMADFIRAFTCGDPVEAAGRLIPAQGTSEIWHHLTRIWYSC